MAIFDEKKMEQKPIYPTKRTPSYADWALFNMGSALEEKVDGMGSGLPEHTSEDAGKVLKVTAQNEVAWATDEQGHAQVQANWNETDNTQPSYIQNKPTIPADFEYVKNVSGGPYTITANGNTTITAETLSNEYYRKDIIVFVTYVSDKVMVKPRQEMDTNQIKFDVVNSSLETTCYIDYTIYAKDITPGRENPEGVNICSVIGAVGRKYAAVPVSTTTDADKVLTVGANGVPAWQTPSGGSELPVISSSDIGKVIGVNDTGDAYTLLANGFELVSIRNITTPLNINVGDNFSVNGVTYREGYIGISLVCLGDYITYFSVNEIARYFDYSFSSVNATLRCIRKLSSPQSVEIGCILEFRKKYDLNGYKFIGIIEQASKPDKSVFKSNTNPDNFKADVGSVAINTETNDVFIAKNLVSPSAGVNSTCEWIKLTQVPPYTTADSGKVLSVNSNGELEWITPGS